MQVEDFCLNTLTDIETHIQVYYYPDYTLTTTEIVLHKHLILTSVGFIV